MKPSFNSFNRLDALARRSFALAVAPVDRTAVAPQKQINVKSLYTSFRALVWLNYDNFGDLARAMDRRAHSMPAANIPACMYAVTHGLDHRQKRIMRHQQHRDRRNRNAAGSTRRHQRGDGDGDDRGTGAAAVDPAQLKWDEHQKRIVDLSRTLTPEDAVSLLHSLSLHGKISPALRSALGERVAEVLPEVRRSAQLSSILYSLSVLGLKVGNPESGQLVSKLQEQLSARAHEFSLDALARVIPKIVGSVPLTLRYKNELIAPLLPRVAALVKETMAATTKYPQKNKPTTVAARNDGNNTPRDGSTSRLAECTVLFLALARLRRSSTSSSSEAFSLLQKHVVDCFSKHQNHQMLSSRQKVLVLYAMYTAGEVPANLEKWYVRSALSVLEGGRNYDDNKNNVASADDGDAVQAEIRSGRWDSVTLSYFATAVSFAHDIAHKHSEQSDEVMARLEKLKAVLSSRLQLPPSSSSSATVSSSSSNSKGNKPNAAASDDDTADAEYSKKNINDSSRRSGVSAEDATAGLSTSRGGEALVAVASALKIHQMERRTHDRQQQQQRGRRGSGGAPTTDAAADSSSSSSSSLNKVGEALNRPMSSSERIQAFCTFAHQIIFDSSSAHNPGDRRDKRLIDEQLRLIHDNVNFAAVETNSIVAYLRVLGRMRMSGLKYYEAPLSVLFGFVPSSASATTATMAQTRKGEEEDNIHHRAGPRSLFPSEAAIVLIVLSRIPLRRLHLLSRLCGIIAEGASDLSVNLRLLVLHSLGQLNFPHRQCTDAITARFGAVASSVMSGDADTGSQGQQQQQQFESMEDSSGRASHQQQQQRYGYGSSSSSSSSTLANVAYCLVGCSASYDVAALRPVVTQALSLLASHSASNEVIARSLKLQMPLALAQLGVYHYVPPEAGKSSTAVAVAVPLLQNAALDAVEVLPQAHLPESWYTVLYWPHAVAPLLSPEAAAKCETVVKSFADARLTSVLKDSSKKATLSANYQLALGLKTIWALPSSSSSSSSSSPSSATVTSDDDSSNTKVAAWWPLVYRLKFGELSKHVELILPACICLSRMLLEYCTKTTDAATVMLTSPKTQEQQLPLRADLEEEERLEKVKGSLPQCLELYSALEGSVRSVTRSDDLALMLLSLRQFICGAVQTVNDKKSRSRNGNSGEGEDAHGDAVGKQSTKKKHYDDGEGGEVDIASMIDDVCLQTAVPLCKSIISALYVRETAPGGVVTSGHMSPTNASSSPRGGGSSPAGGAGSAMMLMMQPTSQLTAVGMRLVCEALEHGILLDGEDETFDIALTVVGLAADRLMITDEDQDHHADTAAAAAAASRRGGEEDGSANTILSAWDAAASLRSLMSLSMAPISPRNPTIFSTMDQLSRVVKTARSRGAVMQHHQQLCASVLPGPGQLGQESSILSL